MSDDLILGITKIGDLLVENKISKTNADKADKKEITNISLKIPDYQRPYKWTAKNANQLLDDIIEAMNENKEVYRVGTLILHNKNNENKDYDIVDGQQRVITFALLLKALNKALEQKNSENKQKAISFLSEKLADNDYNLHNVLNNFRTFERRLNNIEKKYELKKFIEERCELVVVITSDLSEAFQFFDSQNARGKALYPHDLLKAYHLREMQDLSAEETEKIVKTWENCDQKELSNLFKEYLYRLKEWIKGNRSDELSEKNIDIFKGITAKDRHPYAQFYKGAFAYADNLNNSSVPFVTGGKLLKPFQIDAPVIAGKPFFEYAKHYFDILADIKDNNKYSGYFINDNEIVKTLDKYYSYGTGNRITRLLFDTAILLYVDRFCPLVPDKTDLNFFDEFVKFAFIWAYSMRAQYTNVGWVVAQNFITERSKKEGLRNSFNIYRMIADSDSPNVLLSKLSDNLVPLESIKAEKKVINKDKDEEDEDKIFVNYLHFFKAYKFWEIKDEPK
ncbi:DUF262 domain-containing protein [bacterium]|nr:DUF262 domain-containing protein [bacterium]